MKTFPHEIFFFFPDQKLVPEQADEAEEDGAGRPGSRLPGQRRLSADALPRAAGLQAGALLQVSLSSTGGPGCSLLRPPTRPAVQLPSAQRPHSAPGLLLPVQQPAGGHAALCHNPTHGLLPDLPSVLLTLSLNLPDEPVQLL